MRVSTLQPNSEVLAFDREASCLRVVKAIETELVDEYGQLVQDYAEVDTEKGLLWRQLKDGRLVRERGMFYVCVKREVAKKLNRI